MHTYVASMKCFPSGSVCGGGPHRQQVDQVHVGLHLGHCSLQGHQLVEGHVELMHLHQVHLIAVMPPVREDHMHCDQVLQVHPQDGGLKALALTEGLPVAGVVVVGGHQLRHFAPHLVYLTVK